MVILQNSKCQLCLCLSHSFHDVYYILAILNCHSHLSFYFFSHFHCLVGSLIASLSKLFNITFLKCESSIFLLILASVDGLRTCFVVYSSKIPP